MSLVLRLHNPNDVPGGPDNVAMMGDTLTIGRGAENDVVLPDPERELSKRHCVVEHRNGDYVVRDISTNGTFLNYGAERLDDMPTPLNHGDIIQVGSFEFVVEIGTDSAVSAGDQGNAGPLPPLDTAPVSSSIARPATSRPQSVSALDDMADTGADFLDDLLGGPADVKPARTETALDGLLPPDTGPVLDDPFGSDGSKGLSDGSSASNHSPSTQDHFVAPRPNAQMIPDDWADSFIQRDAPTADSDPADDPFGGPTAPPVSPPPRSPGPDTPAGASDVALRAFLDGAGAGHIDIPADEVAQTMARMGTVMAAMVAGMREILMTRAAIKSEMRMDRTMINAGANNPLKFSISPEQAVEAMIKPTVRGYLDAESAIVEALNDVKAHEVATMSGMEAALKDLLARLGPSKLSARIEAGSTIGSLLGSKKARYWEAYEKMYAQIAKETEDDFQSAFGKEFARAYEEQVKKL